MQTTSVARHILGSLKSSLGVVFGLMAAVLFAGCGNPIARYELNRTFLEKQEVGPWDQEIANALAALFGTPDEPFLLATAEASITGVVDPRHLKMAAGPVLSDESGNTQGLYRQHCAHCHGVTGNGAGPTAAFLNPYPRDFRLGKFKFKSTPLGFKPTHDDLRRILQNGIPGTAMPSFEAALTAPEIDALVDYVKFLSIRGEVERALTYQATELDEEDEFEHSFEMLVEEAMMPAVARWIDAPESITEVPERPETEMEASVRRGRALYYGVGGCVKCHGDSQLGDGQITDYDDWTKDFADWGALSTEPEKYQERLDTYLKLGGLPIRNILPRNLRQGVYRGGRRPIDIFWRVHNGIEGTPMPAAALKQPGAGPEVAGVTTDDIWDIVNYVRSLPYEPMSRPVGDDPLNQRMPR